MISTMSTKESKALIKDIRETIKMAKYGDAIHKCQVKTNGNRKSSVIFADFDIYCSVYSRAIQRIIWVTCCSALPTRILTK